MEKAKLFQRYPIRNIVVYNATTVVHFLCGGLMLSAANSFLGSAADVVGLLYVLFSLVEMYILMPFQVCRNCTYAGMENSVCISGKRCGSQVITKGQHIRFFKPSKRPILSEQSLCFFVGLSNSVWHSDCDSQLFRDIACS
jgi:hypothetical protein